MSHSDVNEVIVLRHGVNTWLTKTTVLIVITSPKIVIGSTFCNTSLRLGEQYINYEINLLRRTLYTLNSEFCYFHGWAIKAEASTTRA